MSIKQPKIAVTSQETRIAIKQSSAFSLPNNPSAKGMTADDIKQAFWAPIFSQNESLLKELDRVVGDVNAYLETVYSHVGGGEVEAIGEAYKSFVRAGESGLTALSNATWRLLKDRLESFNAQAQAMAAEVAQASGYATAAETHATEAKTAAAAAQANASDAQNSAQFASERGNYAMERANAANASANLASEYATIAANAAESARNQAETIVNGMKEEASYTCYSRINLAGNLLFGETKIESDNTVWMAEVQKNVSQGYVIDYSPLLKRVFSCRMVEISIQNEYPSTLETDAMERYLYLERTGGNKRFASYATPKEDGGGEGNTRFVYARRTNADDTLDYKCYLKLSDSLANCIRETLALVDSEGASLYARLPIVFKGYN